MKGVRFAFLSLLSFTKMLYLSCSHYSWKRTCRIFSLSVKMLEIKTDGEAPEGRPRNIRVAAISSTDIQVTWEHPEKDTWHGELLGYYVGYKLRFRFVVRLFPFGNFLFFFLIYQDSDLFFFVKKSFKF